MIKQLIPRFGQLDENFQVTEKDSSVRRLTWSFNGGGLMFMLAGVGGQALILWVTDTILEVKAGWKIGYRTDVGI